MMSNINSIKKIKGKDSVRLPVNGVIFVVDKKNISKSYYEKLSLRMMRISAYIRLKKLQWQLLRVTPCSTLAIQRQSLQSNCQIKRKPYV